MLTTKNIITIQPDRDKKEILSKEYDRMYFEFGQNDPVEPFNKTVNKEDLMVIGADGDPVKWEGTRPKNLRTIETDDAAINDMVTAALNFLIQEDPTHKDEKGQDVPNNMWLLLLDNASYGYDFRKRNAMQAELRPGKPLSAEEAFNALVKTLVRSGKTESQAKKLAELMSASTEE